MPIDEEAKLRGYLPNDDSIANDLVARLRKSVIFERMMNNEKDWRSGVDLEVELTDYIWEIKSKGWTYFDSDDRKNWPVNKILIKMLKRIRKFENSLPAVSFLVSEKSLPVRKRKNIYESEQASDENISFFSKGKKSNNFKKSSPSTLSNVSPSIVSTVFVELASESADPKAHSEILSQVSSAASILPNGGPDSSLDTSSEQDLSSGILCRFMLF